MSARTGSRYGVARKPVLRWVSAARTIDTSWSATVSRTSSGTRSKTSARTTSAWRSERTVPSSVDELVSPGVHHVARELVVASGVVGAAEDAGDGSERARGVREERGGDDGEVTVGEAVEVVVLEEVGLAPLPPVPSRCPTGTARGARASRCARSGARVASRGQPRSRSRPTPPSTATAPRAAAGRRRPRHVSHGTSTAASPQPDEPSRNVLISLASLPVGEGSGAKLRTAPSLRWSAARSRSHLVENPATS